MNKLSNNNTKNMVATGLEIIDSVYEMSLACIENNVNLLPNEFLNIMKNTKNNVNSDKNVDKYIQNKPSPNMENGVANLHNSQEISAYQRYKINSGWSFSDLIANCFKINKSDFNIELYKNKIKIIASKNVNLELSQKLKLISKGINKLNIKYEKNKLLALEKRQQNLRPVDERVEIIKPAYEISKSQFVI